MKNTIATGLLAICINPAIGQQHWCGFDAQNIKLNQEFPERELTIHEQSLRASHGNSYMVDRTDPIIIPVVVHVIHDGGEGNISIEQIQSGLDMLNEDFNRLNADTINTRNTAEAPFLPVASDVGIQFMLAKIDPDGNCTNGIERRYNPGMANNADDDAKHYNSGGLDAWNRNNYMNIWIVNSIESSGEGTTLGYAEFPYSGGSSDYGVIIRHDAYGTVGTASGDRTLTHEIGHCLGLFHTFQGGCHSDDCSDNGDYCCDTPPESEAHWSCVTTLNSCVDVPVNDLYGFNANDQWENFMSYAPCQNMFSEDQKAIMLFNLSDINFLANLTSLANQAETGVLLPEQLCKAEFTSDATVICVGNSVQFFDQSYFSVTGRTWNFSGGSPASSTDQNPVITYNTPGVYDISLEVTDGSSSVTEIANDYLIVLSDPGEALPHVEGFESFTAFPDNTNYFVQNDNNQDTWEITEETSYGGSQCVWIDNFGENDGSSDVFVSGTIDLSNVDPADDMVFTFKYAYKKRTTTNDEWLQFSISKDCGQTWSIRKNLHGDQLSEQTQISPYEPSSAEEWTTVTVSNITDDYYTSDFRYKFTFKNDGGNNIYIDNINLYPESMTGVSENELENFISVFPNPVNNSLTIQSYNSESVYGSVVLENLTGQKIAEICNGEMLQGMNEWNINTELLSAGIYFVKVSTENGIESIKIIKE